MASIKLFDFQMINSSFISEKEAAEIIKRSEGTLRNWRSSGRYFDSIPSYKYRNGIFYRRADIDIFSCDYRREQFSYPQIQILLDDSPIPEMDPGLQMTTPEVASIFGLSAASMAIWRSKGLYSTVLPHLGMRQVRYASQDIKSFIINGRAYFKGLEKASGKPVKSRSKSVIR